ncbi:MAG: 2-hydroxyglutaryl-CoA dehydratase [Myxococcales bacterium]|nr:2-hydroxyglutaryl-CoA dehydratase [Myxococcales bacterium]
MEHQVPQQDKAIEEILRAERARLEAEAGLDKKVEHFKRPTEHKFTAAQRPHTTILVGGLSLRHDILISAAWRGLGYNIEQVHVPTKADFQAGKEYGNNGQCNPTYFTVGALVNYLKNLRDNEGMSSEYIVNNYVFMTAGACGPCRFGMYEAEFRLALRNSGFEGFRVLLFQQSGGLDQASGDDGLQMNLEFFFGLVNGILIGDLLNEVYHQVRPFETAPGQTDALYQKLMAHCCKYMQHKQYAKKGGILAQALAKIAPLKDDAEAEKFLDQLFGDYYTKMLEECVEIANREMVVDYTQPKPIVKITGEFWAQTTEGDGNFNMFPFLENEGAEIIVEPVVTWLNYLLHQARLFVKDKRGLNEGGEPIKSWDLMGRLKREVEYRKNHLLLTVAEKIILREYERLRLAFGGTAHKPVNQLELERMGHPFYNTRSGGGEGHLEVAKNIYYSTKGMAHMVLSVKPFGCMPSTQSDGAQAAVISHYPDMIYLPIETSGEGDINAHSRTQMALGEAKVKAKAEFKDVLERTGKSIEDIRAYVDKHPELRRPIQTMPHYEGVVGRAANFVLHVSELMDADPAYAN